MHVKRAYVLYWFDLSSLCKDQKVLNVEGHMSKHPTERAFAASWANKVFHLSLQFSWYSLKNS